MKLYKLMHAVNCCKSSTIQQLAVLALFYQDSQMLHWFLLAETLILVSAFGPTEMHGNGFRSRDGLVHAALIKLV